VRGMIVFRSTVAIARASAALAGGIATIDTGNAVCAANGVGRGVALTTASGSAGSTSATIECVALRTTHRTTYASRLDVRLSNSNAASMVEAG
jgi:hypothetical protein